MFPSSYLFEKIDKDNYFLQYIDLTLKREISEQLINIFIENIKHLKFLRAFSLVIKRTSHFGREQLLALIDNLSNLKLLENIKIECPFLVSKCDGKKIVNSIRGISVKNAKEKLEKAIIELYSDILNKTKIEKLNISEEIFVDEKNELIVDEVESVIEEIERRKMIKNKMRKAKND